MKNKSFLKAALIILGVILVICILGVAVFLLIGPTHTFDEGPAKGQTQAFLQALKGGDYSGAYEFFSDDMKKELKDPDSFEEWVKRNNLQIKNWMPPMFTDLDGSIGVVFTANLANGEQEPLVIVLSKSGDEWKIDYFGRAPDHATPPTQEDTSCAQCVKGIRLFLADRHAEALPLLETGFARREEATCADPDYTGYCAMVLGHIRNGMGDRTGALEAYTAALGIFRSSGNRGSEGTTLHHIGGVYDDQGRYAEALEMYQQSLAIHREVGDRAKEGITLNNIGNVYHVQGRYVEALESFQQALTIRREAGDRAGEGTTLNNIGAVYLDQGRYAEALEYCEQSLAIDREAGDRAEEGITLNNIGEVYRVQGRYAEALEMYQQALAIAREVGDRAEEGRTLNNIGAVYEAQGRYTEALDAYQQALVIHREVGNRPVEGATLNNIGLVYKARGRYAEAVEMYQQALVIARKVGDRTKERTTLNNIGVVYQSQGRYTKALEMYQQALAITREVGNRAEGGTILNNIGFVYHAQGRYAEALEMYQQALVIHREVGNRPIEGGTLNNIGFVYHTQGRYAEALEMYQQALVIHREVGNQPTEGATLNNIGLVYQNQGHYTEAFEMYQQALAIHREVGNPQMEGATLSNIGDVYQAQGRYTEALESYQQALAIHREVGNRPIEGDTLNNIGVMYRAQGRHAEALEMYQQALAIHREVGNRPREGTALTNIGGAYEAQGRYPEALAAYQQAMDTFEAVRAVAGSEQGRASFIAQYADLYARAAGLFHQQGQDEAAFFTSERGRARAFLDSLATGQVQLSDNEAANLLAQEQEAYAQRQAVQDALARARALDPSTSSGQAPPDPDLVADLEAQLAEAKQTYATVQAEIEARGDQLADLVPGRSQNVLGVAEVQALLDEETTLLSYFVLDDQTLAFLITPSSFEVVTIEVSRQELTNRVSAFRDLVALEAQQPDERLIRDRLTAAQALFNALLSPLSPHLSHPTLVIVPHNVLHYLPFAALADEEGTPLAARFTLSFAPSASALSYAQANRNPDQGRLLALGNPTTDLPPLAFAEGEVQAISPLYASPSTLLGPDASEAAFRVAAPSADWIHLAVHGQFNPISPLFSTLHLAGEPTTRTTLTSDTDGWLEVHEVYGLDLREANLVVLSACQTKLGELSRGDELVGLTRAFLYAGTPTVAATLWEVDDEATGVLMTAFHRHLREGMGPAAALRAAQEEVYANEKWSAPYYWAGVQVIGDGGEVREERLTPMAITPETEVRLETEEAGQGKRRMLWGGGVVIGLGIVGVALILVRRQARGK
jgi:tetratricopeptide (TPR) repeat protein